MRFSEGRLGRIFILRLEEGEQLNESIEKFAREQKLQHGLAFYLRGAGDGSRVVVGPEANREGIIPMIHTLRGAQEVLALGTLIPNEAGEPVLHMHAAAGREGRATVGCTRAGVAVWLVGEVVLLEILGTAAARRGPTDRVSVVAAGRSKRRSAFSYQQSANAKPGYGLYKSGHCPPWHRRLARAGFWFPSCTWKPELGARLGLAQAY